ncbi:MAG: shikimate dehydrogenase, partial [bacterium]|nr:shikimate dehydrogenase [bacterium]
MRFGLIGERLGHSYSKEIHERLGEYAYELIELSSVELGRFMERADFDGINVTIPYKRAIIPYLDAIDESAEHIGAVNTVVKRDGKLIGYNTDFAGMRSLIAHAGIDVDGKDALILGTGGTSRTAQAVLESMGAKRIDKVSRRFGEGVLTYEQALTERLGTQIIVNATPVGMYPNSDASPIDISAFPQLEGVIDAIYNPLRTNMVLDAQRKGARACGGLYMLVAQAIHASAIFLDRKADEGEIDRIYRELVSEKRNIVLIGMPSSGKTLIGGMLAQRLGKELLDTDELIMERTGKAPSELIGRLGENGFRNIEGEIVIEVASAAGKIIATGG